MSSTHRSEVEGRLPDGLRLRPLQPHDDDRGTFVELHRREWETGVEPIQWNAVHNQPGVLRGVHVHPRHDDYLTLVRGRAFVGVRDLRPESPTAGAAACIGLSAESPSAITIPHGVAHGFWFPEASTHIYAVSHYWDLADELGCRWDDPALEIPWPQRDAHISPRDEALPSLETLLGELRAVWREGALSGQPAE